MKMLIVALTVLAFATPALAQFVPMPPPKPTTCTTFCSGSGNSRICTTSCY